MKAVLLAFTLLAPLFAIEPSESDQLLCVKRVYVDKLDGDETAVQMRDMLISALHETRLFTVTENPDHADAVLRGSSSDLIFDEQHQSSDGINAHVQASTGSSAFKGGSFNKSGAAGIGETESSRSLEHRHEAAAAVRLVTKDGDVIWSSTMESQGSKFKGSMADVAERMMRKLVDDVAAARAARETLTLHKK
jgi:hypothetical protein